ncbi:MAG: TraB/GumN family protein [Sphingomicrobium sp.]
MISRTFRKFFTALGLAAAIASPAAAKVAAPAAAQPALWSVSDSDTTIYLFGTVHLLPANFRWRSDTLDHAVAGSQELVIETIVDDKNPAKLMSALAQLAFTKGLPPLAERVPQAKRATLAAAVKNSGFPPAVLDQMETWAAALMLVGGQFKSLDLQVGEGVETVLRREFTGKGKPIGELESNVEQFGFFDRLSEKAQRDFLEGAIENGSAMKETFAAMLRSWSSGDVKAIARAFNRDLAGSPELADALLAQRNANWTKWVEARLAKPGTVLVAVGAGHLAGDGSVVAMLKKQGLTVRRVQ